MLTLDIEHVPHRDPTPEERLWAAVLKRLYNDCIHDIPSIREVGARELDTVSTRCICEALGISFSRFVTEVKKCKD